jgi:hypothetical protein
MKTRFPKCGPVRQIALKNLCQIILKVMPRHGDIITVISVLTELAMKHCS